ncbi:FimV/HubP family polar landmark protein [Ramlibacter ginsenosidimutans]|nr:FimV/HubP family polar landmark protein [Ramlibacter ginsenosidimutans]
MPPDRGVGTPTQSSLPKPRLSALALAAALAFGLASPDVLALALGRVTVRSALGEPLRAEVDVPEISPDEVASLRANIASPDTFRSRGMDYNPALGNVTISLQRRPDGSHFLQLASDRPVNEPFVDVILQARWAAGSVQRDFTMLLDPPALRQGQAPLAAQVTPVPSRSVPVPSVTPRSTAPARAAASASPAEPAAAAPAASTARAPTPAAKPSAAATPSGEGKSVTVKSGDTAGRIAAANKPASVSLDQMLVAMLRANPDAFVAGNVNRLKSGAVLDVPSAEQASAVSPDEAHQTLVVQSRDFNEFRRRLAEGVPTAAAPAASREASGRVQAQVEDKKAPSGPADRLTLSKGSAKGKTPNADQIARERQAQEQEQRVAELNKNIADLNRLSGSTPGAAGGTGTRPGAGVTAPAGMTPPAPASKSASAAAPAAAATAAKPASTPGAAAATAAKPASAPAAAAVTSAKPASAPAAAMAAKPASAPAAAASTPAPAPVAAATTPTPAPAPAAAPAAVTPASAPSAAASAPTTATAPVATAPAATASAAQRAASGGAPAAAAKPAAKRAPPPPEPGLLDDVLENPLVPALGVGLLAVLLGFGFYKMRQKRKTAAVDSSFLESRLQPDSFFGASGGQRIDTAETNNPTGSSMVYSPSQLDAAGDVDPVAEADVYLAYGRDLQAEEILKEALRMNPQRVAIHAKLLEIYAKRRDAKAFEAVAAEAFNLTHGSGPEWDHICDLGHELDPANPMYRGGGQSGAGGAPVAAVAASPARAASPPPYAATVIPDLDLDLDFSLGDDAAPAAAPAPAAAKPAAKPAARPAPAPAPSHDVPPTEPAGLDMPPLEMDFDTPPAAAPAAKPAAAPAAAPKGEMLEFDLAGLSLDLPGEAPAPAPAPAAPAPAAAAPAPAAAAPAAKPAVSLPSMDLDVAPPAAAGGEAESPLATKLALAEEFNAIGDADGARSLAEEVLAEASGDLKSRAQRLLAEIG